MMFTADAEFVENARYGLLGPLSSLTTGVVTREYFEGPYFGLESYRAKVGDKLHLTGKVDFERRESGWSPATLVFKVVQDTTGRVSVPPVPKQDTRDAEYFATMKSDLKTLSEREEIYYSDNYSYSPRPADMSFRASDGVRITIKAGTSGWSAMTTHSALGSSRGCTIYWGTGIDAIPIGGVTPTRAGEVKCTN